MERVKFNEPYVVGYDASKYIPDVDSNGYSEPIIMSYNLKPGKGDDPKGNYGTYKFGYYWVRDGVGSYYLHGTNIICKHKIYAWNYVQWPVLEKDFDD